MGSLYLVRHGQASFGADDYDHLSDLGRRQSVRLGAYWRERGMAFDAVITGTLKRHRQTWEGIAEGLGIGPEDVLPWPGLNEYDSEAIIATVHPAKLAKPDSPEMYRHHFRLLRDGLGAWMQGKTQPAGMPSYVEQMLIDKLENKLSDEVGAPIPEPPAEKEPPKPPPSVDAGSP